jgi:hypothetical protein
LNESAFGLNEACSRLNKEHRSLSNKQVKQYMGISKGQNWLHHDATTAMRGK